MRGDGRHKTVSITLPPDVYEKIAAMGKAVDKGVARIASEIVIQSVSPPGYTWVDAARDLRGLAEAIEKKHGR